MSSIFWNALGALVIAPCLVLAPMLAPEHVHEADDDHPHAVAHSHFESHHVEADTDTHDGAELDHDEDRVVWLTNAVAGQTIYELPGPSDIPVHYLSVASSDDDWSATSVDDDVPPRGPPRLSPSLRAPPSPAV